MEMKEIFMKRCIEIAKKGLGCVSPNPMVGCVIVHKNKIISEGYHKKYGDNHAEVNAINKVKNKDILKDSTLYVNLEPCSHHGKTPPCCDLIIKHKIPNVIIGTIDPFFKVSGSGIAKMRDNGINVEINILEEENNLLNKRFFIFLRKKRPYILLKWAQSNDGFIAPKKQEGKFWMTSKESKELVHKWRSQEDGILVGRITAEKDNPQLTNRLIVGKNPIRLIIDKNLSTEKTFNVFNNDSKTIIFNNIKDNLEDSNHFIKINFDNVINEILAILYSKNIQSIIVEGGAKTIQSFINKNLWDEARIFKTKNNIYEGVKSPLINGKIISTSFINSDTLNILVNE